MVRFKTVLAVTALGLFTLTGCGEQVKEISDTAEGAKDKVAETADGAKDKVAETAEGAKDKVAETAEGAKDKIGGLVGLPASIAGMTGSAKSALEAVKSGDFDAAKAEASKLQESWSGISDQVKEKSADGHTKIDDGITALKSGLEGDSPDKDKLTSTITDLVSNIGGIL